MNIFVIKMRDGQIVTVRSETCAPSTGFDNNLREPTITIGYNPQEFFALAKDVAHVTGGKEVVDTMAVS